MSFDEEDHKESGDSKGKLKTFFGFVYAIVIVLAVIFIRQVSVVLAAL
jgi:hypothetical protein